MSNSQSPHRFSPDERRLTVSKQLLRAESVGDLEPSTEVKERFEWDFSSVPDHELEACLLWELSREYPNFELDISVAEHKASEHFGRHTELWWERFDECTNINEAGMLNHLINCYYTRDAPWLCLPKQSREGAVLRVSSGLQSVADLDHVCKSDVTSKRVSLLRINWREQDGRLLDDFAVWLRRNRPYPAVEKRGSTPRDHLRMVGAMRLLHRFSFDKAFDLTHQALGIPLYGRRPSWERARKGALEAFRTRLFHDWGRFERPPFPRSWPKFRRDHMAVTVEPVF